MSDPPGVTAGPVPATALAVARESLAELGLPGLIVAGAEAGAANAAWSLALGRADLDRPEPLGPGRRFPAFAITMVVTAVTALRLVADGVIGLDAPANQYLRTVRLADGEVTVRELLSHTGWVGHGVDNPDDLFGSAVTDLLALSGPVMPCPGPRGTVSYSIGGYGVLGQLIADVTGAPYQEAAQSLVLGRWACPRRPSRPPGRSATRCQRRRGHPAHPHRHRAAQRPAAGDGGRRLGRGRRRVTAARSAEKRSFPPNGRRLPAGASCAGALVVEYLREDVRYLGRVGLVGHHLPMSL